MTLMDSQLVITGLQVDNITSYNKLDVSIISDEGFRVPYKGHVDLYQNEKPMPFIIDFGVALPENAIVYATIGNRNKRVCQAVSQPYGQYQLDFISDDFIHIGRFDLLIWFEVGTTYKQYVQEKFQFNVRCLPTRFC